MSDQASKSEQYLERAAQLRAVCDEVRDSAARELLLSCAEDYEQMAGAQRRGGDAATSAPPSASSERDIATPTTADDTRAALDLIASHGDDARIEAALKAAYAHRGGDLAGFGRWLAVMRAIGRIQRIRPGDGRH
jgi:hypothetical protein